MTKFKKLIATALTAITASTVLCGVIAPTLNAFAEGEDKRQPILFAVSPLSNHVTLQAGEELTYIFTIRNDGSQDLNFKIYAVPYNVIDENYNVNFVSQTAHTQISRWIQFRTTEVQKDEGDVKKEYAPEVTFSLPAAESADGFNSMTLEYKVSVPNDVPAGGQYAAIVVEYVPANTSGGNGVITIPKVNTLVYGSTFGDTVNASEITEHEVPGFLTAGNIGFTSVVANKGNTDFSAVYQFKVEGLFGGTEFERDTSVDVLPDTSRRTNLEWENTPVFGVFKVSSTITAFDQTSEISKIVLKIPFFIIIILILLLTMLVVWIIILIRKRQAKKSRIVV